MSFINSFKKSPSRDYSLSIAATWAGAGSLIVGMKMVQSFGTIPFLIWAFGNVMACIVFGVLATRSEHLRKVFTHPVMVAVIGIMCIFQIWVNMSGVHDSLSILGSEVALIVSYAVGIAFMLLLLKFGMIRNVLTDSGGWRIVYVVIIALACVCILMHGVTVPSLGLDADLSDATSKCIALIPGAFFYPCFWAMIAYNKKNDDGVEPVDIERCFIKGGLLFGVYLAFVYVLAITQFDSTTEIVKGILLAIVASSSLTSFIYSVYLTFGNKIGVCVNAFALIGWYWLVPMGVMAAWTLMANSRLYVVLAGIGVAILWYLWDRRHVEA